MRKSETERVKKKHEKEKRRKVLSKRIQCGHTTRKLVSSGPEGVVMKCIKCSALIKIVAQGKYGEQKKENNSLAIRRING